MSPERDLHVRITAVLLMALGAPLTLFLVLLPAVLVRAVVDELPFKEDETVLVVVSLTLGALLGAGGLLQLIAGRRLWRGEPGAWRLSVVGVSLWSVVGLWPPTVYGLFALLRPRIRAAFSSVAPPLDGLRVWSWVRTYYLGMSLLYLGLALGALSLLLDSAAVLLLWMVAAVMVAIASGYLLLRRLPVTARSWKVHALILGVSSVAVCPPVAIPLLVYWLRPETRTAFSA